MIEDKEREIFTSELPSSSASEARAASLTRDFAEIRKEHLETLQKVREHKKSSSISYTTKAKDYLASVLPRYTPFRQNTPLPSEEHLTELVCHFYPPLSDIKIGVYDFGIGRAHHEVGTLENYREYCTSKPGWSTVRWIDVPMGQNIIQPVLEDIFRTAVPSTEALVKTASCSGPSLNFEVLSLHDFKNTQALRDVLIPLKDNGIVGERLQRTILEDNRTSAIRDQAVTKARSRGTKLKFWDIAISEMPLQLSEDTGVGFDGYRAEVSAEYRKLEEQMLSRHPFFKDSLITATKATVIPRNDGYVLTCSSQPGVSTIDEKFRQNLQSSRQKFDNKDFVSAQARIYNKFRKTGTSTWHSQSSNWFVVHLITELLVSPIIISGGVPIPSLEAAYYVVLQDLKRRSKQEWAKKTAVNLVQDFINYNDEISYLIRYTTRQFNFLERLRCDLLESPPSDSHKNPDKDQKPGCEERIACAKATIHRRRTELENLLSESTRAMDTASLPTLHLKTSPYSKTQPALPTPLNRAKRTRNISRRHKQSNSNLHNHHHHFRPTIIFHNLFRDQLRKHPAQRS